MSIEWAWAYFEAEKKSKEKSEEEKKKEMMKVIEQQKKKEEIQESIKTEEALNKLKSMLENWKDLSEFDRNIIEKVIEWTELSQKDIDDILDKIEEIEDTEWIDQYLPKDTRITKKDYQKALVDEIFRAQVIVKVETSLSILAMHINQDSWVWLNLFSWYLALLDKRLVKLQENHIDIKDNLRKLDKDIDKKKLSLWQRFIKFLKEIFS